MGTEARFARRNENNPEASAYVSASSFVDYGEKKISVDRYDRMSIGDAVKRGEQMAQWRGTNRQFHGWAVLTRADVISLGFDAKASPGGGHFWHADLLLPDDAATDKETHNHYAADLASVAMWMERPTEMQ